MAITRANKVARTTSTGNPITQAVTVLAQDRVIVVLLKMVGATDRAGGAPTLNGYTLTQANTTQKAVTSPECGVEVWYLLNPLPGTYTLTIPNTGALSILYTVEAGQVPGGSVEFDGANGSNATSTNPTCGAITITQAGDVVWSVVGSGATTWAPSAQSGTIIANTDDGAHGGGEQFSSNPAIGSHTANWTFATSDDWGAVAAAFKEIAPHNVNNYKSVKAGDGVSVTERAGFRG